MVELNSTPNFQDDIRNICVRAIKPKIKYCYRGSYENQRDT
jgi:hypothetical protein